MKLITKLESWRRSLSITVSRCSITVSHVTLLYSLLRLQGSATFTSQTAQQLARVNRSPHCAVGRLREIRGPHTVHAGQR